MTLGSWRARKTRKALARVVGACSAKLPAEGCAPVMSVRGAAHERAGHCMPAIACRPLHAGHCMPSEEGCGS